MGQKHFWNLLKTNGQCLRPISFKREGSSASDDMWKVANYHAYNGWNGECKSSSRGGRQCNKAVGHQCASWVGGKAQGDVPETSCRDEI